MPRINTKTNIFLNKDAKLGMMREMQEIVGKMPYENGRFLMADFEDECSMYFGDNLTDPCASVEIVIIDHVYERIDEAILEGVLLRLTDVVSKYTKIPANRIFAIFRTAPMWAFEGYNIEKTILMLD